MSNILKVKRSATPSAAPTTVDLELGEVAVNTYDGKMFIKKDDGVEGIVEVTGGVGTHTIAFHSDTTATGAELDELTDGSETTLHKHTADTLALILALGG